MKVLVALKERYQGEHIADALRGEQHVVDQVGNGQEVLWCSESAAYDVLLIEDRLDFVDGFELVSQLRAQKSEVLILLVTSADSAMERVRGLDLGADDCLEKPFIYKELMARLRALSRRCRTKHTFGVVRSRHVVLDLTTQKVHYRGEEVNLTAREYSVVETLLRKKGRVVERSRLFDSVMEFTEDTMSNLLDVHICNIRKKLGKDFVRTVRGRGFVVEA